LHAAGIIQILPVSLAAALTLALVAPAGPGHLMSADPQRRPRAPGSGRRRMPRALLPAVALIQACQAATWWSDQPPRGI
jgi:hypothetical protein